MEQNHPIPQHISSYQFRLVGDMTLKQFFQLAGGAVISLLFYASPLHLLIKWPAILFFALLGVALAFLPFEERPLEKWIAAFFLSVYSPTEFAWKKELPAPKFFKDEPPSGMAQPDETTTQKDAELNKYLKKTPAQGLAFLVKLDDSEKSFLARLGQLFSGAAPKPVPEPTAGVLPPKDEKQFVRAQSTEVVEEAPAPAPYQPPAEVKPPEAQPVTEATVFTPVNQVLTNRGAEVTKQAQFSPEAAPPNPPTYPNIVVGRVLTPQGKIIDGAIIEIRDSSGRPVRALKSNKVGHFTIATPLVSGIYQVITEKDNLTFEPVTFKAEGAIIPPIEIKSKNGVAGEIQTTAQIV